MAKSESEKTECIASVGMPHNPSLSPDTLHPHQESEGEDNSDIDVEREVVLVMESIRAERSILFRGKRPRTDKEQMKDLTCDICMTTFPRKSNLTRHQKIHANGEEFPCPRQCGLRFVSKVSRGLHVEKVHNGDRRKDEKGPPFGCYVCGRAFSRVYDRNQHEKIHTGETEHICSECGKPFATGSALNWHKQSHLDPEERKTVLCDVCGKNYFTKSALEEHKRRHLGEAAKDHVCDICGSRFYRRSHLKQHLDVHRSKNSTEQFKCDLCDKFYPTKSRLEGHRRSVHVQHDKLLPCLVCSKSFKTNRDLQRHHKIHAGIKEHVCSYCDRAFTQKENLVTHIRTHTGEKPYKCQHCTASFAQRQQLKAHARNVHCGDEFARIKRARRNDLRVDELSDLEIERSLTNAHLQALQESIHYGVLDTMGYGIVTPR